MTPVLLWVLVGAYHGVNLFTVDAFLNASTVLEVAGWIVAPIWLFILLPLSLWAQDQSRLWQRFNLTLIGMLAGTLIAFYFVLPNLIRNRWNQLPPPKPSVLLNDLVALATFFCLPAAIIGGITCLTAAIIHRRLVKRASRQSVLAPQSS
jgi:hypothetical protein